MKAWLPLTIVLFAFVGYVYFEQTKKAQPETATVTKTVTIKGDSIPYAVVVKTPVPVLVYHLPDTGKMVIDTAAILAKYYERAYYNDTLRDTSMLVILNEEVTQNRIVCRDVKFQNLRAQSITYKTIKIEPSPQWLAGIQAGITGGRIGLGAGLYYVRKKDAINLNINLVNPGITAGYYLKFR